MHGRDEQDGGEQHDDREWAHVGRILPAASWQTRGTSTRWLLVVVAVVAGGAAAAWFVLDGRGDDATTVVTTTTPSLSTTTTPATISVKAYFFRGAGLVPVDVTVPKTEAVATAALNALLAG